MADYNEQTQRDKVKAGFKGGPFFANPVSYEKLSFVDGHESEVTAKNEAGGKIDGGTMGAPWSERRSR